MQSLAQRHGGRVRSDLPGHIHEIVVQTSPSGLQPGSLTMQGLLDIVSKPRLMGNTIMVMDAYR
jgi:hypothetical protein